MFKIEDEWHAELQDGEFPSLEAAAIELRRLAKLPWDQVPNVAPCKSWKTCGRRYELVEYDTSASPWKQLRRLAALEVDSKGIRWVAPEFERVGPQ